MSRIDELIAELCPDGVEFKTLGDIVELVYGNGMPKSDFTESGIDCTHYGVWTTETISFVAPKTAALLKARRQQYEHYRDRLLTFKEAA